MRSRREFLREMAGTLAVPVALRLVSPAQAGESLEQAISTQSFLNSIGICVHLSFRQSVWARGNWKPLLYDLGVLSIRTSLGVGRVGRAALSDLRDLNERGIRADLVVAPNIRGKYDATKAEEIIGLISDEVRSECLIGIEGPNEPNNPRKDENWSERLLQYQDWLYRAVKKDPRLHELPVVGPSIWGRLPDAYMELGDLSEIVDVANLHYYTGGRRPSIAGKPERRIETGGDETYALDDAIKDARAIAPGKPFWITEFGYGVSGPGLQASEFFITSSASAKYILRGLAESFSRGVAQTFVYGLIDDEHRDPPRYHGLLTADLRPRPAYDAIRNLVRLLSWDGDVSAQASFSWTQTDGAVKRLPLLQRGDGRFYLIFWQDADSYDRRRAVDNVVRPVSLTLGFPNTVGEVRVFTPTSSSNYVTRASSVDSFRFDVLDELTVVEIAI